jgi:hypothetical protein
VLLPWLLLQSVACQHSAWLLASCPWLQQLLLELLLLALLLALLRLLLSQLGQ